MDSNKIKERLIYYEGLLAEDSLDENILNNLINRLTTGQDSDEDLDLQEKLIITQLLFTHFYNSDPPSSTQFKQLIDFRISRTDDSVLTQHLTLVVIELFNVERLTYSVDDGCSITHLNNTQDIIVLHNTIVERVNDASILLTWSYTLSKITEAIQSYTSDIPQSHEQLSSLLLPTDQPQPLYQIIYSQLLHPQFNLFDKLNSFCISNTIQRASNYNSLAYKSIIKGLVDATLSIVHPSFVNDFEGLVSTFTSLLSSSTITVSAPLAHQFWNQYDSRFPASLILDVSRGRWPLDFFSLVKLLLSLSGVSSSSADCQDEQIMQASEASERVFLYFASLTTYTTLFGGPSSSDESDPLIRIANETSTLPGLDKSLAQHSLGRQLSPLNQQPPAVICWGFNQGLSGWNVLGRLLSDWLCTRSTTRRKTLATTPLKPLFEHSDEHYDKAVQSSLDLIGGVLGGNPDLAPLLIEQIGGSVEEEEELDLVAVLFAIIDKCLSTLTTQRSSGNLSHIVASSINILTSLLQSFPGRVWTFLRGGTTIFTPESPIMTIEKNIGTYSMSKALLRLAHALFTESQQTIVSADPAFTKLKNEVLVRIVSWSVNDVYIEHPSWRYVHLGDKLEIGLILSKLYADIVEDGSTLPALTALIKESLLSSATAATLSPLVGVVASSGDIIAKLYMARRVDDASLAESVLETTLMLAQLLLVSEKEGADASLLRRVFFDRSVALAAGASVKKETKHELVDMLAVYIANKQSTGTIRLESTRLLTVLCAYTMPSSSLAGFFADPHSTVMGLVDIVADPYSDDELRAAVWDLCAVVVATQPGLATLLLTGQSVGAAARELIKERNTESVAGKKEEKELKKTALDIASENVEIWSQLWESSSSLLNSVLRFLDIVWQNLEGHLPAVKNLRADEGFWTKLGDIALKNAGDVPPSTTNDTDSLIEDGSTRDGPADAQALSMAVVTYSHRISASSFALSIVSNDRSNGGADTTSASAKCTERLAGKLQQIVETALRNSVDTDLHSNVHSSIKLAYDGLDLAQYHNIINPQFGATYVFNTSLLKVKLDGFVASSASAAEAVDADLVYATMEHIKELNLDWSIVDAQVGFTRSAIAFVSKACSTINTPVDAALCATQAASEAALENRQGAVMIGVHAERLTLILKLLEVELKKSNSDANNKFNPTELIVNVEKIVNLPTMPVSDSCKETLTPPFHTQAMQIIFLSMHFLKSVTTKPSGNRQVESACQDILATVITCLATSLEVAKGGSSSDEEFDLLVMAFMALVKSPLAPSVAYWLPLLVDADVIRLSLEVFNKIALNAVPQPINDDAMMEDDADVQPIARPLFLQAVIDLHLILASFPQAAERMALDGLVAAYSSSTLAGLAEQGAVLSYDPAYNGARNPWHTAWCRLLSVLIALINVLGGSSQFIDIEIIGFIQLSGSQLANVLSWNTETPFNLATVEELNLTISLFVSIANSAHYAYTTSYGHRSLPSKTVLQAFNIRAMYLLQQLTYGLTHPHLILQLVEPITSNERERLNAGGEDGGEFFEGLLLALVAVTNDVLFGVTGSLDCLAVLARQRPEWPAESYALVQPNANININEMASIGTLLDLASYCIDSLKSGDEKKKKLAKSALEATLVLTATQMAMWAKSSESDVQSGYGRRSSLGASAATLKRDISGALFEDFNAIVDRSKGVLNATERRLPVIIGSFMERVVLNA